ncbi:SAM-dependent methyltransferase [Halobacillus halophilus]|uniref:Probable methyltransferase n=1 Tax=Halobacillus halophilus (strain ATCC 35676 / DSM 2266 / JCM 20832 / KCTC 3685 / LMG 17431 / NBRC 102448 / NCIMB 2269) TaxID=866895 RepID=I0JHY1_HALH3|nr:class I SAM-dependent methyltransferase [Halobacillus halophilus]ASF37951.1 SAM-dependent methyltransferase [Halobacillus halophilus]CCG43749.1 probable methyltransferase [Halobacillus halophilus DSM 2266]
MVKNTGERVIPEYSDPTNNLLLEHAARYQFSLSYMQGRVLDLSCGAGYGTHMIAKQCKHVIDEVIGVDIDEEIIRYAKGTYYHPKSSFEIHDAIDPHLSSHLGTFDVIVSFETYEHIKEEEKLLHNYYQLLNPGGKLIISTPFGKGRGKECGSPFHVHQITPQEFRDLFTNYAKQEFFYQNGVLIEPPREDVYYPLGLAVCEK